MDKELRFRVWDGDKYVSLGEAIQSELVVIQDDVSYALEIGYSNVIIEQFTGLTDKKTGAHIYAGDKVIADCHWTTPHTIEWPEDMYDIVKYSIEDCLEVVGNSLQEQDNG